MGLLDKWQCRYKKDNVQKLFTADIYLGVTFETITKNKQKYNNCSLWNVEVTF